MPGKPPLPNDIPVKPDRTYKDNGWKGWGDWLGTGTVAFKLRKHRPFKQARAFVHSLNLKKQAEWWKYCHGELPEKPPLPPDIPTNPNNLYKDKGWKGVGDWLGTGTVATFLRRYRPFKEARAWVNRLNLRSGTEWRKYCKGELPGKPSLPKDIPANPNQTYKNKGWRGWGDWLGTGAIASRLKEYRPFKEARAWVNRLNLKSETEWRKYRKGELPGKPSLPKDIPANPNQTYKNKGWRGMGDWLGTGTVATFFREYRSFKEARGFVHRLKLKSSVEWRKYCQGQLPGKPPLPKDIPLAPNHTYRYKGWKGMGDWLGKL